MIQKGMYYMFKKSTHEVLVILAHYINVQI